MAYESEYSLADRARQSIEAADKEKQGTISIVTKDNSNRASFPGFPYQLEARGSNIIVNVDLFKSGFECKACHGKGNREIARAEFGKGLVKETITCEVCNGVGATLVLPDTAKTLPCTGVVVSAGPEVGIFYDMTGSIHHKLDCLKLYDRVIFGPYSGRFIPISKAGVLMKIMDQREATAVVYGGEDLAAFDFIDIDKEME